MIYELKDKKDKKFMVAGTLENILEFLNYPQELNFTEAKYKLKEDKTYHNEATSCYLQESIVYVVDRENRRLAQVYDVWEGLNTIQWFETQDDEFYTPNYYDVVDEDYASLL